MVDPLSYLLRHFFFRKLLQPAKNTQKLSFFSLFCEALWIFLLTMQLLLRVCSLATLLCFQLYYALLNSFHNCWKFIACEQENRMLVDQIYNCKNSFLSGSVFSGQNRILKGFLLLISQILTLAQQWYIKINIKCL